ncbi:MAG: Asp23/Gls24 family envelope stress response protein [Clostridia bacterium]|nr:Asp23/Gls24 family envelope stress response protein [Clostridia bacterium]MBP5780437.1 Asp23/Gls24 family envelope stress response protein [Clostridia bacterium]
MADNGSYITENDEMLVTDEALAVIAGMAAMEVNGVAGMSTGFTGGLAEVLGRTNLAKGVKVLSRDGVTTVDIYVIVKYGVRIPEVAFEIQEHVRSNVENQAGIVVDTVNIHVQGVDFSEVKEENN